MGAQRRVKAPLSISEIPLFHEDLISRVTGQCMVGSFSGAEASTRSLRAYRRHRSELQHEYSMRAVPQKLLNKSGYMLEDPSHLLLGIGKSADVTATEHCEVACLSQRLYTGLCPLGGQR